MGEGPLESLAGPNALVRLGEVECPGCRAASRGLARGAPDSIPHVGIGRVMNSDLPEVAQVGLVLLDLLVAPGKVQRDLFHVMHVAVADVPNLEPCRLNLPAQAQVVLQGSA